MPTPSFIAERDNLPKPWNPDDINPALMTFKEYYDLANPKDRFHDDHSYDADVAQLNNEDGKREGYTHLLGQKTINGIKFEIRMMTDPKHYAVRDPDGPFYAYKRDADDNIIYKSAQDVKRLGYQPEGFDIAIFNPENQIVARAQDEWGAMLIRVAREYRGFGLGPLIGGIARKYEPAKDSGGFTGAGLRNFRNVYREYVRDALKSGLYHRLVKSGKMTMDRAREIINSAKIEQRIKRPTKNLDSSNPNDWLVFIDGYGTFIVYDKKLRDLYQDDDRYAGFVEKMFKAMVYVDIARGFARIRRMGGDTKPLKSLMLSMAIAFAAQHECRLFIEPEDVPFLPNHAKVGPVTKEAGYDAQEVIETGPLINYTGFQNTEKVWRKSFDEYDEFKSFMHERGDALYRQ